MANMRSFNNMLINLLICLLTTLRVTLAFSVTNIPPTRVLVTGAAGRTGRLVFDKLQQDDSFDPVALVRSERSGRKLIADSDCGLEQVMVCDIVESSGDLHDLQDLAGLEGTDCMVICTSAVPVLSKKSLFLQVLKAPWNVIRGNKALDFKSFRFKFKRNQYPELIDYQGQVAQIDLAKKLGMNKIVVVSSMGGTDPDNFLNAVGKKPDGSGNGDILLWKRKAEKYLVDSGMCHTIIHPGGLVDDPSDDDDEDNDGLAEEIVLDVDDKLMGNTKRSISRANVASLCVAALKVTKDQNVSCDCISRPVKNTEPRTAVQVLKDFTKVGKTANYSL